MGNVKKERRKKGGVHLQGAGLRSMLMLLEVKGRQVLLGCNCRGEVLKAWAEQVDADSMAIAECLAIGLVIQAAIEEGYEQVKIEGDAKIVFDAICNIGQSICWELHQYVEMIRSVVKASETPKFCFNWVPRILNKSADALVKWA